MVKSSVLLCIVLVVSAVLPSPAQTPPGQVLDLTRWKLTLPLPDDRGAAREIAQPELATFIHPEFFHTNAEGTAVIFRAPCGAPVTKGSKYPRSELREMQPDGRKASWSTTDATVHRLEWEGAFLHLPEKKPGAVCVQIHDAEDDVIMVRLDKKVLSIERNKKDDEPVLTRDYQFGTRFKIVVEASDGHIRVWYNDQLSLDWPVDVSGCYFKAGCYTQSNVQRGDKPEAYGETEIYSLTVSHTSAP